MVGSVSLSTAHSGIQRYMQSNSAQLYNSSAAKAPATPAADLSSSYNAELAVSSNTVPHAAAPTVSETLTPGNSIDGDTYASELFGRMRLSPAADEEAELSPQTEQLTKKEERLEEKQEAEQLEKEKKAEEKREAYLEAMKEQEEARAERIKVLKEAQSEGNEEASGTSDEETSGGVVTFDRTAALLHNYQMNHLMRDLLSAQAKGQDTSGYSTAIDAMRLTGGEQVHFAGEETKDSPYASQSTALDQFLFAS